MTLSLRATILSLFIGLLSGLSALQARAQAPQVPEIAARAYLLVDVTAQQVLAELDADKPIEPASLTKLMTAYVVFDALKAKKIRLDQTSLSANALGKCLARACSSTPKCKCLWWISSRA